MARVKWRSPGSAVVLGGILWLAGVVVLEAQHDQESDSLPPAFPALAVLAGALVCRGMWVAARTWPRRMARVSARLMAACALMLGLGFGAHLLPFDTFLAFLVSYTVLLFLLPVAFAALGVVALRAPPLPHWAGWSALAVAASAVVTYGFHALARDVWDPPDAVWFIAVGGGWVLLGVAMARADAAPVPGEDADA